MKDKLVSIEVAKQLKELGFDWQCRYSYDLLKGGEYTNGVYNTNSEVETLNRINTPELWQVNKWIREVKDIHIDVSHHGDSRYAVFTSKSRVGYIYEETGNRVKYFSTYELGLEEGIIKALMLIENNQQNICILK